MIIHGKFRRFGKGGGFCPDWKKAIVTVKKGQKIDFAEQPLKVIQWPSKSISRTRRRAAE